MTFRGGTPGYIAPELARGGRVRMATGKSDMWAVGLIGFELLTGREPPFDVEDKGRKSVRTARVEEMLRLLAEAAPGSDASDAQRGLWREAAEVARGCLIGNPSGRMSSRRADSKLGEACLAAGILLRDIPDVDIRQLAEMKLRRFEFIVEHGQGKDVQLSEEGCRLSDELVRSAECGNVSMNPSVLYGGRAVLLERNAGDVEGCLAAIRTCRGLLGSEEFEVVVKQCLKSFQQQESVRRPGCLIWQ